MNFILYYNIQMLLKIILIFILITVLYTLLKKKELFSNNKNILLISNNFPYHLEILESLIVKNNEIIKKNIDFYKIVLKIKTNDKSFIKYIEEKYTNVLVIGEQDYFEYNYFIDATYRPYHYTYSDLTKKNHYYISHIVDKKFDNTNTFYLTPLCNTNKYIMADILPFSENKKTVGYPVFLIIGDFKYRNTNIIEEMLDKYDNYDKKFLIKYMTRKRPKLKKKYKNLKICVNYNFVDFHKEILDCYCMLMLISKKNQPKYYKTQLTSSINYILAYKMKAIIDKELKDIYNLNDNDCYIYDEKNIINQFEKVIDNFYS